MLNLCINRTVLSHVFTCLNKTFIKYVARRENTKSDTYILQDEDNSYTWDSVKIDPVKN